MSNKRQLRGFRVFIMTPTGLLSAIGVFVLLILAILGSEGFGSQAIVSDMARTSEGPSADHLLGTDPLGRDIFLRTLAATRTSLISAFLAVLLAVVLGGLWGSLTAVGPPRIRRLGAALIDMFMSFGDVLLAIVIIAIIGRGMQGAIIAIGVAFMPTFARFTHSVVSGIMTKDYLLAARATGLSKYVIFRKYVMRNSADALAVAGFTSIGEAVMAMAALSFLGLGVQSPDFDWGQMLTDGVDIFYLNTWAAIAPALVITFTGLTVAFFGDALARAVNPILWSDRPHLFGGKLKGLLDGKAKEGEQR